MTYQPYEPLLANGTNPEDAVVPPIPSIFDPEYYLFRPM